MIYVSKVLNQKIWDVWGNQIGRCKDILTLSGDIPFNKVIAIEMADEKGDLTIIPIDQISSLFPSITLKISHEQVKPFPVKGNALRLNQQVLDHQIVDVEGKRVVRVNDIQIAHSKDGFLVTGVDVSNLGLLRRLGWERLAIKIASLFNIRLNREVIFWEDVAYVEEKEPLRLNKSREKISKLPPADIAMIIRDLDRSTGQSILEEMNNEVLADTLEESPVKTQLEVISRLEIEKAVDVLEEMDPDEAADLLSSMPTETSNEFLELMEEQEAQDIRSLLDFPPDSAGGIMTTDYAWIYGGLTAGQAIEFLRSSEDAQEVDEMYYIHVIDQEDELIGVIVLRDLVMAHPDEPIEKLMDDDPITVTPFVPQNDVAYLIAKYDLLSIPVIDENTEKMLGIVTLDDAIDTILPTAYKKRLPRFFE